MTDTKCPIELRLEKSKETAQPYFWRVCRTNGDHLAYSENYTTRQGAIDGGNVVIAGRCTYSVFKGTDNKWYWHIKARNGEILARGSFKYTSEAAAQSVADLVRINATAATFYDYAKAA